MQEDRQTVVAPVVSDNTTGLVRLIGGLSVAVFVLQAVPGAATVIQSINGFVHTYLPLYLTDFLAVALWLASWILGRMDKRGRLTGRGRDVLLSLGALVCIGLGIAIGVLARANGNTIVEVGVVNGFAITGILAAIALALSNQS